MRLLITDSETNGSNPGTPSISDKPRHQHERLLERVKEIARGIEGRVRHALNPTDVPITQLRILVVDDHPDSADSLAAILELLGCSVRTCYDGLTALTVAAEFEPHICLLDLMMPKMDGLELGSRLKARAGARPLLLIATTALGDVEMQARTALVGFHHHFTKPVDIPNMIEVIVQMGEHVARTVGNSPDASESD